MHNLLTRLQRDGQLLVAAIILIAVFSSTSTAQTILAKSTFDTSDEGWTQVNIGGDFRYLDDIELRGDCPQGTAGTLAFCDPDAGEWMFNAPPKFLGNKSAALDGYIEFSSGNYYLDVGDPDPDPYPNVAIVSGNTAIVVLNTLPDLNKMTSYHYVINETTPWLWIDDTTPMDDLPRATRAQIQQVLSNITIMMIRGEAITGDDQGFLDDVVLAAGLPSEEAPKLTIRKLASQVEITWPRTATPYGLEMRELSSTNWTSVPSETGTNYLFTPSTGALFRLKKLDQAN